MSKNRILPYLIDPNEKLPCIAKQSFNIPFHESFFIFSVEQISSSTYKIGSQLGNQLDYIIHQNKKHITIEKKALLASFLFAKKTNQALLFAHTHPSSDDFPKEFMVSDDAAFSEQDIKFNKSICSFSGNIQTFFLVLTKTSYCCVTYPLVGPAENVSVLSLDSAGYRNII